MKKSYFKVQKTARYYSFGSEAQAENLWLAFHGYGQQSKYFVPKLRVLDNGKNHVVVPEALNRFYLSGYNGRVGATWMTSDDREVDIQDNHAYLNNLMHHTVQSIKPASTNVIAFSQGIATACRWIAQSDVTFTKLILWAGSIPPDLNWLHAAQKFNQMQIVCVFGQNDEFFDSDKIESNLNLLREAQIDFDLVKFGGGHEIDSKTLSDLI